MKVAQIGTLLVLLLLGVGCSTYPGEPAFIGRRIEWFEKSDPQKFFEKEKERGLVYFISFYDSKGGNEGAVPGISRDDPYFDIYRTWLVPTHPNYLDKSDAALDAQYLDAVRRFAEKYNPLVLEYLRATGTKPTEVPR